MKESWGERVFIMSWVHKFTRRKLYCLVVGNHGGCWFLSRKKSKRIKAFANRAHIVSRSYCVSRSEFACGLDVIKGCFAYLNRHTYCLQVQFKLPHSYFHSEPFQKSCRCPDQAICRSASYCFKKKGEKEWK